MLANRSVLVFALATLAILLLLGGLLRWQYQRRWQAQESLDQLDRRYHLDILALLSLFFLTAGFFWRPLFDKNVTMPNGGGDLVSFFYPLHVFASQSLYKGELPLWNPNLFAGMPFLADIQSGLFYPINWLFWLGGQVNYQKIQMLAVLHYWLAACFTYAFARSLNLGRWPSLVAAILYAFGGFAVSHLGHLPMLATAAWFPLILLATNQAAKPNASWKWAIAVGLFLAISFFAGHFQLFLYNFYATFLFWLALAWRKPKQWRKQLSYALLSFIVLAGATLVQVWPFYELGQASIRAAINYETATTFGVWPIGLIDLLLPNLFSPNPQAYFGYWSNTDVLGYLGLFVYVLAALAIWQKPVNFYAVFFVGLGVAGLILALAGYTILHGWLYGFVPAFSLTRAAGRFLVWFNFGFAIAAAYGLQNWLDRPKDYTRFLSLAWRSVAGLAVALALIPLSLLYLQILLTPASINDLVVRAINGLVMAIILLGLAATLLKLYKNNLNPNLAAFLTIALLIFDLFSARAGFNPQVGDVANGFYHDDTAVFLAAQDPQHQYRLDASVGSVQQAWQANTAQRYNLQDVRGVFNPLQLTNYETLWNALTSSQKDFRAVPAYDLLGAKFVIARNKEDPTGTQFKLIYQDQRAGVKLNVFENERALPRIWLVHQAELKKQADMLPALLSPDFEPKQIVLLETGRTLNGPDQWQPTETLIISSQTNSQLEIELNLVTEGYVTLNQPYYPGWQATLDNQAVTIERANGAFGAVFVEAGKHHLKLEFWPTAFNIVWPISLLTWLISLATLMWPHRIKIANPSHSQESL